MKRRLLHLSPLIAIATLAFVFATAQTNQSNSTSQSSSGNGKASGSASSSSSASGSQRVGGSASGSGSGSGMSMPVPTHVIAYTPAQQARTLTEVGRERVLKAQFDYLQRLAQEGKVTYHGPWRDMPGALTLLSVRTDDEARQIAAGDPAVMSGYYETDVRAWKVTMIGSGRPVIVGR